MNKLEQAARQALEALEVYEIKLNSRLCNEAITALREALAQPQEEKPQSDNCCKEADGCPTELAVLQRFWRQAQPQGEPVASSIKQGATT